MCDEGLNTFLNRFSLSPSSSLPRGIYVDCAISQVALLLDPLISMLGSKKSE